jgi:hypothetical protein
MALSVAILSEFNGKGIEKARQEFAQLEGAGAKAGFVIKKAMVPATAAIGALAAGLFDATKAAIEDAQSQTMLAEQLRTSTKATDRQIAAVENWISTQGRLLGVTDDQLRPAIAKLTRATNDVGRAQKLAAIAMDISAATGKDLESVTTALAKAENGQYAALKKLGIPLGENTQALADMAKESKAVSKAQLALTAAMESGDKKEIAKATDRLRVAQEKLNAVTVEGADFADDLSKVFGGAATESANTAAGQFQRLSLAFNETKESIGAALLPAVEAVLPVLQKFGAWAQENPQTFLVIAAALGAIAVSIMAINVAMALNPIGLIVAGVIALVAAVVLAYKRFETVRTVVDAVFGALKWYIGNAIQGFKDMVGIVKAVFNGIAQAWNNTFGKLSFTVPSWVPGIGGKGFAVPDIPMLAEGGVVTGPTLAMIGEAGPEAVIPLDRMGSMGAGSNQVTINVNGGDPNAVVDALRRYMRQNGSVPIRVSNAF